VYVGRFGMKKLTQKKFIKKSREKHGDKYSYEKSVYVNTRTKLIITCLDHGDFEQRPSSHLNGIGCPECGGTTKKTTEQFIEEAKSKHGDRYSYEKSVYINNKSKLIITCLDHGDFEQNPNRHLNGQGCPKCYGNAKKTTEQFIEDAKLKHGDRYSYEKSIYVNNYTKLIITCPEHGDFEQKPNCHLRGDGCPKCYGNAKKTVKQFIEEAKEKHGDKYSYEKSKYVNNYTKLIITCPEHGDFEQAAHSHLRGAGCPECAKETLVGTNEAKYFQPMIEDLFPDVIFQHDFVGLPYYVDAFIPSFNLVIEYDEPHHFNSKQKEKDDERQAIIEDYHDVRFIRVKDEDMLSDPNKVRKRLDNLRTCL
jgi:very-short-patch-repair endonuclease